LAPADERALRQLGITVGAYANMVIGLEIICATR
jgi:hypothetical protein